MSDVRWAYAINQWDTNIDSFVRKREHERAFKTVSISGFSGIELTAVSFGAWEPLGTPQQLADLYGSVEEFGRFLASCAIDAVSSYVYDPSVGFEVEMGRGPDPLDPASVEQIVRTARWFADALRRLGGSVLVVRAAPSAWQTGALSDEQIGVLADLWNTVGAAITADGIALGLHVDFLSALRLGDGIHRLLASTDAATVGLAIDTAEYAIAGIDPVALYRQYADRVVHVQLKDARETVGDAEASTPHAEQFIRTEGGARKILRWFYEPSDERALVDFEGFFAALAEHGYRGWIVVESDQSPHPAESTMVAGWYVQKVLQPILEGARVSA